MRAMRPRRYVRRHWLTLAKPFFRWSVYREAYVLRVVGRRMGPVLREDRRVHSGPFEGAERRRGQARTA